MGFIKTRKFSTKPQTFFFFFRRSKESIGFPGAASAGRNLNDMLSA
jgi:hypothetical protein